MSQTNGTGSFSAEQAAKFKCRNQDFPLRWHPNGGWCKKIRGRVYYFGRVTPDEALTKYEHDRDYLKRGEVPPAYDPQAVTLRELVNEFLAAKEDRITSGEMTLESWDHYKRTCGHVVAYFGRERKIANLRPADFTGFRAFLANGRGLEALGNEIGRCRSVFKFAHDSGLVDSPVRYGQNFGRPGKAVMRKVRASIGRQDFMPSDVQKLLKVTTGQLHCMILLGVNCGLGTADVCRIEIGMIDLAGGWLDYPRPKTGVARRCPLWPETIKLLQTIIGERTAGLVFETRFLNPWSRYAVRLELGKVLKKLGLTKRQRVFYGLRRTFRTIADEAKDQPAADLIMGHVRDDMASIYRQAISDERLRAVSEHVRNRLSTWHGWIKRVC